jgi:hypothetical protein
MRTTSPSTWPENYMDEFKLGSLNAKYRTDIFEISSTTSYWTRHEPLRQDTSESWTTGLGLTAYEPSAGGLGAAVAFEDNPSHQTTEELRISSVGDSSLKWVAGYFYEDFESAWDITFPSENGAALFGSNAALQLLQPEQDPAAIGIRRGDLQHHRSLRRHPGAAALSLRCAGRSISRARSPAPVVDSTSETGPGRYAQGVAVL